MIVLNLGITVPQSRINSGTIATVDTLQEPPNPGGMC